MAEQAPIENIAYAEVRDQFEKARQVEEALDYLKVKVKQIEDLYLAQVDFYERDGLDLEAIVEAAIIEGRIIFKLKCIFMPHIDLEEDDSGDEDGYVSEYGDGVYEEMSLSKKILDDFQGFLSRYFLSSGFLESGELNKLKELGINIQNPLLFFYVTDEASGDDSNQLLEVASEPSIEYEIDEENNAPFVEVYVTL